jgi:hypothetical protein
VNLWLLVAAGVAVFVLPLLLLGLAAVANSDATPPAPPARRDGGEGQQ